MAADRATIPEIAERLGLSRRAATAFIVARFPDLTDSEIPPDMRQRISRHRDAAISRGAFPDNPDNGGR